MYEPSGRGDYNMRYIGELAGLFHHVDAADDDRNPEVHVVAREHLELLHYLKCQLPRRGQHQPEYPIRVRRQLLQYRDRKTSCLTATRLGKTYQVLPRQGMDQGFTLNPSGLGDSDSLQVFLQPVINFELLEVVNGLFGFHYLIYFTLVV